MNENCNLLNKLNKKVLFYANCAIYVGTRKINYSINQNILLINFLFKFCKTLNII